MFISGLISRGTVDLKIGAVFKWFENFHRSRILHIFEDYYYILENFRLRHSFFQQKMFVTKYFGDLHFSVPMKFLIFRMCIVTDTMFP